MQIKGIDVSHYQGTIDWAKVKAAGYEFAMIKATFGWDNDKQIDSQMHNNAKGCEANGVSFGFYHYSYAECPEDAKKEALFFLKHVAGYKTTMPVAFDFEEAFQIGGKDSKGVPHTGYTPEKQLAIIDAFLGEIEKAGYFGMLYMSKSALQRLYDYAPDRIGKYAVWVAHVDVAVTSYTGKYGIWQYSWKGSVSGITVPVDMNIGYVDYPTIIKKAGLNGWGKTDMPNDGANLEPNYQALYEAERAAHDTLKSDFALYKSGIQSGLTDLLKL